MVSEEAIGSALGRNGRATRFVSLSRGPRGTLIGDESFMSPIVAHAEANVRAWRTTAQAEVFAELRRDLAARVRFADLRR